MDLQVRTQRRKKLRRPRVPMPTRPNERWSVDFMSDQLANGRRFRILNVIDDFSRQCVGQIVDTSISGARLAFYLDQLGERRPLPKTLVCDNGTELTSKAMFFWSSRSGTTLCLFQRKCCGTGYVAYSSENVAVPVMLRRSGLLLPTRGWSPYRRNIIFCVHRDFRKAIRPLFSFHGRLGPGLAVS